MTLADYGEDSMTAYRVLSIEKFMVADQCGSHFVNAALDAGHAPVVPRREGSRPRVPLAREPSWLELPLARLEAEHFDGVDAVVHLAAHKANVPYDMLDRCLHWNVAVQLRVAERARRAGVEHFVFAGSCFEYGHSALLYVPDARSSPILLHDILHF